MHLLTFIFIQHNPSNSLFYRRNFCVIMLLILIVGRVMSCSTCWMYIVTYNNQHCVSCWDIHTITHHQILLLVGEDVDFYNAIIYLLIVYVHNKRRTYNTSWAKSVDNCLSVRKFETFRNFSTYFWTQISKKKCSFCLRNGVGFPFEKLCRHFIIFLRYVSIGEIYVL